MNAKSITLKNLTALIATLSLVLLSLPVLAVDTLPLSIPGLGTMSVSSKVIESFDRPDAWGTHTNSNGAQLDIEYGVYRAYTPTAGYVWGLNTQEQMDGVTDVQITPLTIYTDVGAGIMCRADVSDNGNGYYFMINPNGYYSIRMGQGSDIIPLIDWQRSKAIHTGIDQNTIRAVCLGDHLAMYVNDELVASVVDDTYNSGYAGLAVAGGIHGTDMSFDNLTLYSVQPRRPILVRNQNRTKKTLVSE